MRFSAILAGLALALTFALAPSQAEAQGPPKVINVLMIDTKGDLEGFLKFAKRARELQTKHGGTGVQRVWQSTLAGPNTGTVAVAVEYQSMVAMAQSQAKVGATPEWQKFVDDFQASGMNVLSNSVSIEVSP